MVYYKVGKKSLHLREDPVWKGAMLVSNDHIFSCRALEISVPAPNILGTVAGPGRLDKIHQEKLFSPSCSTLMTAFRLPLT